MSTPVVTDKWAGNFDCSICRRKRLVGSEFSKKALEKYRKSGHPLKCKTCVTEQERKERALAASKREAAASISNKSKANSDGDEKSDGVPVTCASCKQKLLPSFYNRNQLSKGEGKARCRSCVEEAIANEAKHSKESKDQKIAKAKEKVRLAKNATEKVCSSFESFDIFIIDVLQFQFFYPNYSFNTMNTEYLRSRLKLNSLL